MFAGLPSYFPPTTLAMTLVVLTAIWAVWTAEVRLALVEVSSPKAPAIRGTSPADSIRPSPSRAWSLNTISPATRMVDWRNAVRHRPTICLPARTPCGGGSR